MTTTPVQIAAPKDRLEQRIEDLKPPLSTASALTEAERCLYCFDAPCVQACPTAINIPQFIKRIAAGNVRGAAKTILESNILGHSCARVCPVEVLCAGSCVYNEKDEPAIAIGKLQRYATDWAYGKGVRFFERGKPTGKKVALIGAGPASLAAAHELARLGHECVIFEGRDLPGGLNTTGVAPYKLQADTALQEVEYVLGIGGIELRTGTWIGKDVTFEQLERDYDAVFLGVGLGPDSRVNVPGEELPGSIGAVELIEQIKNQPGFTLAGVHHAAVIGGGNTAIDIARELRHLGVPCVFMVYRRTEESMTGYKHELAYAKQEGVTLEFRAAPAAIEGTDKVTGLRCHRVDDALKPIDGADFTLTAELVVKATGQDKLTKLLAGISGLSLEKGKVAVNAATHQTSNPKYFAGGDCVNGGKEVVNAAAEGKRAAHGIDAFLRGAGHEHVAVAIK